MYDISSVFMKEKSLDSYSDAATLELLLLTADVHEDPQFIIENLFSTFGGFRGILEARPEQLMKIPGITRKAATLIAMVAPLARIWERVSMNDAQTISNRMDAEAYCRSLLMGERNEHFYVIALNAQCRLNGHQLISEGSLNEVSAYPRRVVEAALNLNAYSLILCHNHPGGTCAPSAEDLASTLQLQRVLRALDVLVFDHIIVAGNRCYSMAQHGDIDIR